jgi:hypothetical protein
MQSVQEAFAAIREVGTVEEVKRLASKAAPPQALPKSNTHIHLPPNFSAFETVEQAVGLAAAQQLRVLGVANYYHYAVYGDFARLARRHAIFPLFGLEIIALLDDLVRAGVKINDPGNPGKMYLCGKGITRFDPPSDAAERVLGLIRENDSKRMAAMLARLAEIFQTRGLPTGLDENAVKAMVVRRHGCAADSVYLQERHVAQAFQEALFERVPAEARAERLSQILGAACKIDPADAVKIQNAIRAHLMKAGKPAFVQESFVTFEQAYRLILELGGLPCYPTLADGTTPICAYEEPVEKLIDTLLANKIYCVEFIPIRNKPDVLARYVLAMRRAGLVVTAGTEHNTRDLLPLEPTCGGGEPVPEELKTLFWEGTCVLAAHQFLVLNGRCGFVTGEGARNPAYKAAEKGITAFRKLGAQVIESFGVANS